MLLTIEKPSTTMRVVLENTSGPLADAFCSGHVRPPCFLGVSLMNKMANRRDLSVIIPWIADRAGPTKIVIGDFIDRHNRMAFEHLGFSVAAEQALRKGRRATRYAHEIVAQHGLQDRVQILSSAQLTETSECKTITDEMSRYYAKGDLFAQDVVQEIRAYLERSSRGEMEGATQTFELMKRYVLEELSMFICLYQAGVHVEVYPGADLAVMRRIAEGAYHRFPYTCPKRTHISIQVSTC